LGTTFKPKAKALGFLFILNPMLFDFGITDAKLLDNGSSKQSVNKNRTHIKTRLLVVHTASVKQ